MCYVRYRDWESSRREIIGTDCFDRSMRTAESKVRLLPEKSNDDLY